MLRSNHVRSPKLPRPCKRLATHRRSAWKTLVSLYAVRNLLSFADLRCCSEITATGCIIGIVASGVESTLNSLQTSNRPPPTTLYFLVFCYAPAGISQHQK